jgi:hypothetical protein
MTLELEVFCLKKPNLEEIRNALSATNLEWCPNQRIQEKNILAYDWRSSTQSVTVRFSCNPLIIRDDVDVVSFYEAITAIEDYKTVIPHKALSVFGNDYVRSANANEQLLTVITEHPALLQMHLFRRAFDVVQHSKGKPTHQVEIATGGDSFFKANDLFDLLKDKYEGIGYK